MKGNGGGGDTGTVIGPRNTFLRMMRNSIRKSMYYRLKFLKCQCIMVPGGGGVRQLAQIEYESAFLSNKKAKVLSGRA
jgi:hypothetical protein